MAEIGATAAAIAVTVLRLSEVLHNYACFLPGVRDRIERLKRELNWMQSFLKDAENKQLDSNNLIQEWMSDVQDLAYEAENVIDNFLLKLGLKTNSRISSITSIRITHKLGLQLDNLMERANDISSRRDRYGLSASIHDRDDTSKQEEKLNELRSSSPYAANENMIGLGETVHLLQGKLTNGGSGRFVKSILGMGGLGKTTLARNLYNKLIHKYFQSHARVCVSQEYDTQAILLQLIKSMINPECEVLKGLTTKDSMEVYLRNHLNERRFLVVIDDVWKREASESFERVFPDNNKTSRVIITTRIRYVAEICSAYVHELRYLTEDESWELFCRKSFQYDNGMKCPPNLEQLGKEMVSKCAGLPLTLVTLGGLLSTKSLIISAWEMVRDNLLKELKKGSVHIDVVLALSYKDLPYKLKQCFLCIGMFPEDFNIPILELMWLWEAEGFTGQEEGRPEDITKSYFNELVGRSLLQKTSEDWADSTCRIHDLLRELAISKAKEIGFSTFYDGTHTFDLTKAPPHRRLAIYNMHPITLPHDYSNSFLRTFRQGVEVSKVNQSSFLSYVHVNTLLKSLDGRFNLLKVLDIEVAGDITNLSIGKMIHLRYLGIKCSYSSVKLPKTIGDLSSLQTIRISSMDVVILPKTMVKLQNLKHLMGFFHFSGDWIGKLSALETLGSISFRKWCEIDTTRLVNLRYLTLNRVGMEVINYTRFHSNFESLFRLHTFVWDVAFVPTSTKCLDFVSEIFKRCPTITRFESCLLYEDKPYFLDMGVNLEVLQVRVFTSHLSLIASSVGRLPKLRALRFSISNSDQFTTVMDCSKSHFPQLRTLEIILRHQKEDGGDVKLIVAEDGMPLLINLHVNVPEKLIAPDRLKQLITVTP